MAYHINLTNKQERRLREIVRENQNNKNILKRAYCILLRNDGQNNDNIIRLLDIHEDTIADWVKIYTKQGLDALLTFKYHKRRKSKL
ncbi:MAG: helix-turn-helix domain-containing protein, partial [Bacteroidota bacterium]